MSQFNQIVNHDQVNLDLELGHTPTPLFICQEPLPLPLYLPTRVPIFLDLS